MTSPQETILITGAAGFIGQELAAALLRNSPTANLILTDTTTPYPPPNTPLTTKIHTHALDLTSPQTSHPPLLAHSLTSAYLLHGIMSAGSEANLPLSLAVNLDSHRLLLDALRNSFPGLVTVFPSSIAALGPCLSKGEMVTERTPALPQSSYGAHKLMIETLLTDYSRRRLLDGRILRLPTVIVRPGAPSAAASSFASGIVRESLQGKKNVLPVRREVEMWICSPGVVVENLVRARQIDKRLFEGSGRGRVVNLPGRTVTIEEILGALKEVGGDEAMQCVKEARNGETERIVESWPARFDTAYAASLGFRGDVELIENVRGFAESLCK